MHENQKTPPQSTAVTRPSRPFRPLRLKALPIAEEPENPPIRRHRFTEAPGLRARIAKLEAENEAAVREGETLGADPSKLRPSSQLEWDKPEPPRRHRFTEAPGLRARIAKLEAENEA
jgi:hypothetical protein